MGGVGNRLSYSNLANTISSSIADSGTAKYAKQLAITRISQTDYTTGQDMLDKLAAWVRALPNPQCGLSQCIVVGDANLILKAKKNLTTAINTSANKVTFSLVGVHSKQYFTLMAVRAATNPSPTMFCYSNGVWNLYSIEATVQ